MDFGHGVARAKARYADSSMRYLKWAILSCLLAAELTVVHAAQTSYTGTWRIDLRSVAQKQANADCGYAKFKLKQVGTKVTGSHVLATVGCGRLNEGGEGSVKGTVESGVAVLAVTSGRNGAIVLGQAIRVGRHIHWQTRDDASSGTPGEGSALILGHGVLHLVPTSTP